MGVDADAIAKLCIEAFTRLPTRGKPNAALNEWTVLAGVVMQTGEASQSVVSLATGCKCLAPSQIGQHGQIVHDSHAEVLARRGLQRFLYSELEKACSGESAVDSMASSIVFERTSQGTNDDRMFRLKPGVKFHFYVSQAPCGDASMAPLAVDVESQQTVLLVPSKSDADSALRGRRDFSELGRLRTKPGRADAEATRCMSCSDKLARWNVLGFQGALLSTWIEPIYFASMTIGDYFDRVSLQRALIDRCQGSETAGALYRLNDSLVIASTSIPFLFRRKNISDTQVKPSPLALNWNVAEPQVEVLINGRKQGASSKHDTTAFNPKLNSRLCKHAMALRYLKAAENVSPKILRHTSTYADLKRRAGAYNDAKTALMQSDAFRHWIRSNAPDFSVK